MSLNTTSPAVILRSHRDWDLWYSRLQELAETLDVWEYIDPESAIVPGQKPEPPTALAPEQDADGSPATLPDPAALTRDMTLYRAELKEYRRTQDKISQVRNHITNTIQQSLLYHIIHQKSVRDKLKTLQALFLPSKSIRDYQVRSMYNSAKVFHSHRENIEDWAITYLTAFDRAKQLNLPEVADFRPHQDLLRVVDQIHPSYASLLSQTIYDAEEVYTGSEPVNPSAPQLLAKYLAYYRTVETKPARSARQPSAYAARAAPTLNSEPSPYHKRKRTQNNTPSKPCLCGDMHYWGQCPYIDETQRQKGFLLDPEKAKKVVEFEAKDRAGLLNKIREKNNVFHQ